MLDGGRGRWRRTVKPTPAGGHSDKQVRKVYCGQWAEPWCEWDHPQQAQQAE
ncbi:hypothetical protein SAMN05444320_105297 [Streptoalloteichus hindustanus]|uniref:Uncharacterized protein n=1 Tax=Streptoalloteichus hindustanus TaxID=2017 RepID=A0A1M5F6L9_STRHI|nr:hypothetical protein SAMN05444320_105297 [Streptoalloteichus hindustanus]